MAVAACGGIGAPPQTNTRRLDRARGASFCAATMSMANGVADRVQVMFSKSMMSMSCWVSHTSW
jgi:hypothetical protein